MGRWILPMVPVVVLFGNGSPLLRRIFILEVMALLDRHVTLRRRLNPTIRYRDPLVLPRLVAIVGLSLAFFRPLITRFTFGKRKIVKVRLLIIVRVGMSHRLDPPVVRPSLHRRRSQSRGPLFLLYRLFLLRLIDRRSGVHKDTWAIVVGLSLRHVNRFLIREVPPQPQTNNRKPKTEATST